MLQQNSARVVRTRIPPSPTGEDIHIGNLYTALINYAFARKNNGKFIIRIEDTDRTRFQEGSEERILSSIKAYGLSYDEAPDVGGPFAPYRQSERLDIYQKFAQELIDKKNAYYCFCSKERLDEVRAQQLKEKKQTKYDKFCLNSVKNAKERIEHGEKYVIRLDVKPNGKIVFKDKIRGEISINSNEVDDQVLIKSDGYPTYHLGVVVDDHLMEITHVIRAEEWISSTPKHILLYQAFAWDLPEFVHLPILRNPDKSKLSKRKNPVWASWYLKEGILPEAMLNYLALLGWSHPEEKEIFSLEEFISLFKLEDIKPVGPIFDLTKLRWMNQQYIQNTSDHNLKKQISEFNPKAKGLDDAVLDSLMPLLKTRIETLLDFEKLVGIFFGIFLDVEFNNNEKEIAGKLKNSLENLSTWKSDMIFEELKKVMADEGIRMPILYKILTGEERGLPLPQVLEIYGKEKTLQRIENVIGK